jgi:hypothetical protein
MSASPSRPLPPYIIFRALGAGLLVLCLGFLLFALGFFGEGMLDLADGRMNGHVALNLPEHIAIDRFWRRIGVMMGCSAVLLVFALGCFLIACVLKPKP